MDRLFYWRCNVVSGDAKTLDRAVLLCALTYFIQSSFGKLCTTALLYKNGDNLIETRMFAKRNTQRFYHRQVRVGFVLGRLRRSQMLPIFRFFF